MDLNKIKSLLGLKKEPKQAGGSKAKGAEKSKKSFDINNIDWRVLQRYFSPRAFNDLNAFLEDMPQLAGKNILIVAGVIWCVAGGAAVFATMQMQQLTELKMKLLAAEALNPKVPSVTRQPVKPDEFKAYQEQTSKLYPGLVVSYGKGLEIKGGQPSSYVEFREALGLLHNQNARWRVTMEELCLGRECDQGFLAARLRVDKIVINRPSS